MSQLCVEGQTVLPVRDNHVYLSDLIQTNCPTKQPLNPKIQVWYLKHSEKDQSESLKFRPFIGCLTLTIL